MVYFNRFMATLTAGLLIAILALTVAHFVGLRVDPERAEVPSLMAAPVSAPQPGHSEMRPVDEAQGGEPGV